MLIDGLLDDSVKFGDFTALFTKVVFGRLALLLLHLVTLLQSLELFCLETELVMLGGEGLVLGVDFVFELTDLVLSDTEFLTQLDNLIVGDDKVLTVKVTIGTDDLVQVLLLLELAFKLDVLFLEFTDEVSLQLDLLDHLHEVGVGLVGSLSLLFLLRFNLSDRLD